MTGYTIKQFYGRRDGLGDPNEYLEDIEYAIESRFGVDDMGENRDRDRRMLFRQNLRGNAEIWHSWLPKTVRGDWNQLKELFTNRFRSFMFDEATKRSRITHEINCLKQRPTETIATYIERCEELEVVSTEDMTNVMGMNMVNGLTDADQKRTIYYELAMGRDFSFRATYDLIIAAYMSLNGVDDVQHPLL